MTTEKMKAIILDGVGEPFRVAEIPKPVVSAGEVLIKVKAAAFNHRDIWIRKGQYGGLRFPSVQGSDGCGTVETVGEGVNPAWLGKEVIINPSLNWGTGFTQAPDYKILGMAEDGTFAQYVKVAERLIHARPSHLNAAQAACLPLAGLTAFRALFIRARAASGENVLVTGVGGGVALFAAQFAMAAGCNVYVTSGNNSKIEQAMALGAKGGANYRDEGWEKKLQSASGGFHAIIDSACGDNFSKLVNIAKPAGRLAFYGATLGEFKSGVPAKIFWKQLDILGSTMGSDAEFKAMIDFVEKHGVHPVVDSEFTMEQVAEAARKMEAGEQFGKIVLKIT